MAMIEVNSDAIAGIRDAIGGLHGRLAKMGKSLDARFRADDVYPRENPIEAIGSLIRSCENTTNVLEKCIADSATEQQRLAKQAAMVPELEKIANDLLEKCEAVVTAR